MTKGLRQLGSVSALLAQANPTPLGNTGGISYDRLVQIVYGLVEVLLQLGEFVAVGFITYYGVRMVTSRGDPTKYTAARKGLLLALLGAIIIFGVYTIIKSLQGAVESIGS